MQSDKGLAVKLAVGGPVFVDVASQIVMFINNLR